MPAPPVSMTKRLGRTPSTTRSPTLGLRCARPRQDAVCYQPEVIEPARSAPGTLFRDGRGQSELLPTELAPALLLA
jgi:hypothetical protein